MYIVLHTAVLTVFPPLLKRLITELMLTVGGKGFLNCLIYMCNAILLHINNLQNCSLLLHGLPFLSKPRQQSHVKL